MQLSPFTTGTLVSLYALLYAFKLLVIPYLIYLQSTTEILCFTHCASINLLYLIYI